MEALLDMGFSELKAKIALKATGNQSADSAIEWLLAHPEVAESADEDITVVDDDASDSANQASAKKLSDEERAAKAAELQEKLAKRRKEKQQEEEREALEKEKRRMNEGKEMTEAKRILAEKEMLKMAEDRKREKIEDKLARQRVRDQIEADRQARRAKQAGECADANEAPSASSQSSTTSSTTAKSDSSSGAKREYSETRLQIRLLDGSQLVQKFGSKENLAAVRVFIEMNRKDGSTQPFNLGTVFPRKIFSDPDYDCPLDALGLVPSAVVIMSHR